MISRRVLLPGLLALSGSLGMAAATTGDWQAATVALAPVQLGPHSWLVVGRSEVADARNQGFMSNAGFVITPAGVVVIDALATPALAEALLAEIRKRTQAPIRRLILTHYHADHDYGIGVFQREGAPVEVWQTARAAAGSEASEARLEERMQSLGPWLGPAFTLPRPDRWLTQDEDFELGGVRFKLRYAGPAHSPDDLVVQVEPDGVAYTGDLFYAGRIPYVGEESSTRPWLAALDRLQGEGVRILAPGHGPATDRPREVIDATRRYLQALRREMGAAVAELEDFETALARADFSEFSGQPAFAEAHRVNAYNVFIEMERESLEARQP
jgi:glyoxylase-like metal-dependent hydrolase (beta-lactamase superfamily II)